MRIAYANASYNLGDLRGRNAHIHQFIHNAVELGHEVWSWAGSEHPEIKPLPRGRIKRFMALRRMDAIYVRLQGKQVPDACRYGMLPYRPMLGNPLMVWEFNTVPEFGEIVGAGRAEVQESILEFRRLAAGCDLAVCVSRKLADYVRERLGIKNVVAVPNGSDPDLFSPAARRNPALNLRPEQLNVVWIGSADLAWHNFDLLISTAHLLQSSPDRDKIHFHVIGKDFPALANLPENMSYHGAQPYDELPGWLAPMDIGLVLYHPGVADYNSPLKMYDYMASGLALVGNRQPQLVEILTELDAADLALAEDRPEFLADLLLKLAHDRQRIEAVGKAARESVLRTYNWQHTTERIFQTMEQVRTGRHLSAMEVGIG